MKYIDACCVIIFYEVSNYFVMHLLTCRKDIMDNYEKEKRRAINYLSASKARVAVTSDMWTSDNQKRGYMAITAHFIDDLWRVRSILMR